MLKSYQGMLWNDLAGLARDLVPAAFHLRTAWTASSCPACPSLECPQVVLPACPALQCGDCTCPEPGLGPLIWAGACIALASAAAGGLAGFALGALAGAPWRRGAGRPAEAAGTAAAARPAPGRLTTPLWAGGRAAGGGPATPAQLKDAHA